MMETLEQKALHLAEMGFFIFPLWPGTKEPAINNYSQNSTRDPKKIKQWWGKVPEYNIGISTHRYGDHGEALLAIDVDNKDGRDGDGDIFGLELGGYEFPITYQQTTPTGGRHIVYSSPYHIKQGTHILGTKGLDSRSYGGYLVGWGSKLRNTPGTYTMCPRPVRPAPGWLLDSLPRRLQKKETIKPTISTPSIPSAIKRGQHYLEHEHPVAEQGQRNDSAFKAACRLKELGLNEFDCLETMMEHFRCEPMLDMGEIIQVITSAFAYGHNSMGSEAPQNEFTPVTEEDLKEIAAFEGKKNDSINPHPFEILNKEFAYVLSGGAKPIIQETTGPKGEFVLQFLGKNNFIDYHAAWKMTVQDRKVEVAKQWMKSKHRRTYEGLCFMPGKECNKKYYNLWRGFRVPDVAKADASPVAVEAVEMYLEHIHENICKGDPKLAQWLIGYFAHLVQRPWEKPSVAIVFTGRKGVGKSTVAETIKYLLGGHAIQTGDDRYLVGNFNAHMAYNLLLILEEACWAGDKKAEGMLKNLITSKENVIENKGKDPILVDSCSRVCIIGNEQWVIPATEDERRFAVFNVGEGRMQDRKYFTKMRKGMEAGGYSYLLHVLKNFDLSDVDVDEAPKTEGLHQQKEQSLSPFKQWWLDCLHEGVIVGSDNDEWVFDVVKDRFRRAFMHYLKDRQIRQRIPDERAFGRLLRTLVPTIDPNQKIREEGKYLRVYRFPDLKTCRKNWEDHIGHDVDWEGG